MRFLHRILTKQSEFHHPTEVAAREGHKEPEGYIHPNFRHWSLFRPTSLSDDAPRR